MTIIHRPEIPSNIIGCLEAQKRDAALPTGRKAVGRNRESITICR